MPWSYEALAADLAKLSGSVIALVLARHEAIKPREIARVSRPGGCFLSHQVIKDFMRELGDHFTERVILPDFFSNHRDSFSQPGMYMIRAEEYRDEIRFTELGHLAYQLVATPWTVPGFTIDTQIDGLVALNEKLMAGEHLVFSADY